MLAAAAMALPLAACSGIELRDPPPVPTQAATFATSEIVAAAESVRAAGAPALLVEVRSAGEVWRSAFGVTSLADSTQPDPLAAVRIASVTKSMIGTILMELVDEGRLDLDAPISGYLPELRLGREVVEAEDGELALAAGRRPGEAPPEPAVPAPAEPGHIPGGAEAGDDLAVEASGLAILNPADRITPRMLAQHETGLPEYVETFPLEDLGTILGILGGDYTQDALLARTAGQPWTSQPGGGFAYSNTNYLVLSMLIEELTGSTVEDAVRERIVERGALEATSLPRDTALPEGAAEGYVVVEGLSINVARQSASLWSGAGGVVSTVGDVNSFYRGLMQGAYVTPGSLGEQLRLNSSGYGIGIMGRADPCPAGAPIVAPTRWPDADSAGGGMARPFPTWSGGPGAPATSGPATTAPSPDAAQSPTASPTPAPTPTPTAVQIGEPGMTYGHLGSGLGYRILSFSSPDGLRQATVAWTASPVDYGADPRLELAYGVVDAALAATCGA